MARLPDDWIAHLQQGVTLRVGSSTLQGQPELHFAHGAWTLPDGRMELLVRSVPGADLLDAIRATGRVAVSAGRPSNYRVLHVKGVDAEVLPAYAEQGPKFAQCFEAWLRQIEMFGADRRQIMAVMGELTLADLSCVRFTPLAAWDQTPGPGAGQPIDLMP
ncbi:MULTISPECIES: hypothetical protein [unclassified Roseateles]|uniref:hypothetical protein n=1 Tax=unclassified Roseateles TaxID=2626991 RepID=UPI0006FE156A|nr:MULTISPECIES: hypothetical protein [unclassified Roseateles]KQW52199.1 hypothetical protein ASC81_06310 [Pelomonas sp. Root405]KRA78433.1 hypothetical protein ASD88_06315 [Pelomonas sp. Root662]